LLAIRGSSLVFGHLQLIHSRGMTRAEYTVSAAERAIVIGGDRFVTVSATRQTRRCMRRATAPVKTSSAQAAAGHSSPLTIGLHYGRNSFYNTPFQGFRLKKTPMEKR
jgi:hypothetical protein